jgi:hypothetical protein
MCRGSDNFTVPTYTVIDISAMKAVRTRDLCVQDSEPPVTAVDYSP